jgi:hypothetical protein
MNTTAVSAAEICEMVLAIVLLPVSMAFSEFPFELRLQKHDQVRVHLVLMRREHAMRCTRIIDMAAAEVTRSTSARRSVKEHS